MKKKYMHTMDGEPAYFDIKSRLIVFAQRGGCSGVSGAVLLVDSVDQIHRNERISRKTVKEQAHGYTWKYDWVNVLV